MAAPAFRPVDAALQQPACQGWLGTGPLANATALPGRANPQAVRARGAKPGAKAAAKAKPKAAGKAGKPTRAGTAKPQARRASAAKPAKPAR
jgi:hypothetical protein